MICLTVSVMEKMTKITTEAVRRYFNSLSKFGYKNYVAVEKLLVLTHLEELLDYDILGFVSKEDYSIIIKALEYLAGSTCLIDFPSYATYDNLVKKQTKELTPRIDESGIFRVSETSLLRIKM